MYIQYLVRLFIKHWRPVSWADQDVEKERKRKLTPNTLQTVWDGSGAFYTYIKTSMKMHVTTLVLRPSAPLYNEWINYLEMQFL